MDNPVTRGYFNYAVDDKSRLSEYKDFCIENNRPLIEVSQSRKYSSIKITYHDKGLTEDLAQKLNDLLNDFVLLDYTSKKEVNEVPENKKIFTIEYLTNGVALDFLAASLPLFFLGK